MARGGTRKKKGAELAGQGDPRAALDAGALLSAARPVLERLRADLGERAGASGAVTAALEARHAQEKAARRTADGFAAWRERLLAQVAASWFLSCVFVRTLEDRGLLGRNRLAGPGATDSQSLFFSLAPSLSERDYLLFVFREMTRFPAARPLFDPAHCLVWKLAPSAEVARDLLGLFRHPTAEAPAFRFGQTSTRFLGDLYQDLDEEVRKRFALLQTPDFIESFILDRTLEPAIEKFGLDDTTLIDPTCGSGHFLLGAFDRLFDHHLRARPDLGERKAADLALAAVFGADINPYAVAIARFRLTLAYLEKAGFTRLADAPALPLHLVVADSLLHNPHRPQTEIEHHETQSTSRWRSSEIFALEDESAAKDVLHRQYAAVVGNPPYITEKDSAKRELYREMYPRSAAMQFSLAAPFCERFFQLGRKGGLVGQITANSFMKREFGKKLIQEFLPTVNLATIVNTSGAYVPGHGTPTILLFGTADDPQNNAVLTVLAKRGEPSTPADPSKGEVWSSIAAHWSDVGFENDYISVAHTDRAKLVAHPWSLGGGGAVELKELLEKRAQTTLGELVVSIGRVAHTGNDEAFVAPVESLRRSGLPPESIAPFVEGEIVRDWALASATGVVFPYDSETLETSVDSPGDPRLKYLWPYRSMLWERREPNGTHREIGLTWYEFSRFHPERFRGPCIAFAFVATHNHFVLDRGGKVFKQSAPIIKLPATATEDDHLALLAYLNSSTACFWMKQVFFDKGNRGEGGGITSEAWEKFYEFDGTKLRELCLPPMDEDARRVAAGRAGRLLALARDAADAADLRAVFDRAGDADVRLREVVSQREAEYDHKLAELRAEQEALDWWIYSLFGLADPRLAEEVAPVRVSDVLFARQVAGGDVGRRYFELCRLPPPEELVLESAPAAHLQAIESSPELTMLEQPTFKRTFREGFRPIDVERQALDWLTGRAEQCASRWHDVLPLSDLLRHLHEDLPARAVLQLVATGREQPATGASDVGRIVAELVQRESVPFLAALRFSGSGLAKHSEWLALWDAQRREDQGGAPPSRLPAKYAAADFRAGSYFSLRGKLDVPKETFISYPGCESDEDHEPVYGWAGWNHLERARALGTLYYKRKTEEGWTADRLTPMLAGLLELLPWVKQWHAEPDPEYGGQRPGDYFEQFLDAQCQELGLTRESLLAWRPAKGRAKAAKKAVPQAWVSGGNGDAKKPRRRRGKAAADAHDEAEGEK